MCEMIRVSASSKSYNIYFGKGALGTLPGVMGKVAPGCRAALISDSNVYPLYGSRVEEMLARAGILVSSFVFQAGERSKNKDTLFDFLEFAAKNSLTRSDTVIALGGGVTGDIGGFAASIYQRGIKVIQIPTSLLAMADSSVGGKTAIDLEAGKNLAGTFWQPEAVICDTSLLSTLPEKEFRDGCAEVLKYGIITDEKMFEALEYGIGDRLEYAVKRSIEIKRDIVGLDERDHGLRGLLNFGHTVGHAVEKLSGFEITHGSAVAIGMVAACRIAAILGMCDITDRVEKTLERYGFAVKMPYPAALISKALRSDKKRNAEGISLILPERLGRCVIRAFTLEETDKLLEEAGL